VKPIPNWPIHAIHPKTRFHSDYQTLNLKLSSLYTWFCVCPFFFFLIQAYKIINKISPDETL
jgi:hypothetical protein